MTTRRDFLKGTLAAAVIAAVPAFPVFAASDRERLQTMLDAGIPVVGQHFVITGRTPVILPKGAMLHDSTFEFLDGADDAAILVLQGPVEIHRCQFICRKHTPVVIRFKSEHPAQSFIGGSFFGSR